MRSRSTPLKLLVRDVAFVLAVALSCQILVPGSAASGDVSFSFKKSLVWGPGLQSSIVMPARYFFIQAVNDKGENITESLGENFFSVSITDPLARSGSRLRVWLQILDRHDGSYIVRYKLYNTYQDLMVEVLHEGKHIATSPYRLNGPVYHEKCYCPEPSLDTWTQTMGCSSSYEQITKDLSIFPKVDMEAVEKEAVSRFNRRGSHSLCHYVVKDNKIYRKTYGQHVGFKMFMDAVLLSLTRKVRLPDMDFFLNLGDWPLEKKTLQEEPIPIFSWCGSDDTLDIVMPTYDVTESTLETMGRVTLDLTSVQANTGPKWGNKTAQAFWRGRDSRQERLDLVKLSRRRPDLLDARLTNMFFFKHSDELGELVKPISFFDFFKYKYQVNLDGTVAAYRLPYLLAGDALVLKQDSPYYEFFYSRLTPYEHYVPFKRDISDIEQAIQWAKDNDDKAQQIAKNAQAFIRENLMADDVYCYHAVLFKEYATRLVKDPYVREGMELVEQPSDHEAACNCLTTNKGKDEF